MILFLGHESSSQTLQIPDDVLILNKWKLEDDERSFWEFKDDEKRLMKLIEKQKAYQD